MPAAQPNPVVLPAPRSGPDARLGSWLPLLTFLALLAALAAVFRLSAITVRVSVDGTTTPLTTHAGTVADLLLEHGVPVRPGDLVVPGPEAHLEPDLEVAVRRARPVRLQVDGTTLTLVSHARTPRALLLEAGVALGPGDRVAVNGAPSPLDDPPSGRPPARPARVVQIAGGLDRSVGVPLDLPQVDPAPAEPAGSSPSAAGDGWAVDVLRAVPVTLVEDGIPFELALAGTTVGEALELAGVPLYPEDDLSPPADTRLRAATRLVLRRATPFVIHDDGASRDARARADTVGEALARAGLPLAGRDYTIPPPDTPLSAHLEVEVVRVVEDILVREVEIPFERVTQADPALPLDEQRVLQPGATGLKSERSRITYENGNETSREVIDEEVLRAPTAEIVAYGTQVVWRTVDTPEGPKQYWRHLRAYATSYSPARSGTPQSAPWYGRSRMGLVMRKGIIAVDPRVIPLGMWLYVPGYGLGIAGDTGGGIRNYHIDLGFADDDYESWHKQVDVYIVDRLPPEHQMPWILP